MKRYPLLLSPQLLEKIWGGKRLAPGTNQKIGESWEVTCRFDRISIIQNGPAAGLSLSEYFATANWDCVSPNFKAGDRFPLLIKRIDAADDLSVQVHPDDLLQAAQNATEPGKTEFWYVLDCEPGARILYGLNENVSKEAFCSICRNTPETIPDALCTIPVHPGDCFFLPAGQIHALGKGVLVAEIQQNSDTTYRLYDYGRKDTSGKLRTLHIEQALTALQCRTHTEIAALQFAGGQSAPNVLADCAYFHCEIIRTRERDLLHVGNTFHVLMVTRGSGALIYAGASYPANTGDTYFLPAGVGQVQLSGSLEGLWIKAG